MTLLVAIGVRVLSGFLLAGAGVVQSALPHHALTGHTAARKTSAEIRMTINGHDSIAFPRTWHVCCLNAPPGSFSLKLLTVANRYPVPVPTLGPGGLVMTWFSEGQLPPFSYYRGRHVLVGGEPAVISTHAGRHGWSVLCPRQTTRVLDAVIRMKGTNRVDWYEADTCIRGPGQMRLLR